MSKTLEWSKDKRLLAPKEIAERTGINKYTVHTRFKSKYAHKLWGVNVYKMPNGKFKRFVPTDKLVKWADSPDYRGRPVSDKEVKLSKNQR